MSFQWHEPLPWKITGLDIHLRICWRWPFWKCSIGKVWHLPRSHELSKMLSEKTSLPPFP